MAYDSPGSPSAIPWRWLDDGWAQHNHSGQSLQRLAERGGLSPCEALAVIERRKWHGDEKAGEKLAAMVRSDADDELRKENAKLRELLRVALKAVPLNSQIEMDIQTALTT